jgi:hypothetical protein
MKKTLLFKKGKDWWNCADVSNSHEYNNDWNKYALGYKHGAEILVQTILNKAANPDILIYPIIFLYRQYFELRLKEIFQEGNLYLCKQIAVPIDHDLINIWNSVKAILLEVWPNTPIEIIDEINSVISQLDKFDRKGMAFRYPTDTKGNRSLTINDINIRIFKEEVEKSVIALENASRHLSAVIDFKDVVLE